MSEKPYQKESITQYKERYLQKLNQLFLDFPIQTKEAKVYLRVHLEKVIEFQSSQQASQVDLVYNKTMNKFRDYSPKPSFEDRNNIISLTTRIEEWVVANQKARKEGIPPPDEYFEGRQAPIDDLKSRYDAMKERQSKEKVGIGLKFDYSDSDSYFDIGIKGFLKDNPSLVIEIEEFAANQAETFMKILNSQLEYKGFSDRVTIKESEEIIAKGVVIDRGVRYGNGNRNFSLDQRSELLRIAKNQIEVYKIMNEK